MRALLLVGLALVAGCAALAPAQQSPALVRPPPPDIYDPNPGPYLVFFAGDDVAVTPQGAKIIANAIRGWRDTRLGALLLCYHARGREAGTLRLQRTRAVAELLFAAGAQSVTEGLPHQCEKLRIEHDRDDSAVQIDGVMTFEP